MRALAAEQELAERTMQVERNADVVRLKVEQEADPNEAHQSSPLGGGPVACRPDR